MQPRNDSLSEQQDAAEAALCGILQTDSEDLASGGTSCAHLLLLPWLGTCTEFMWMCRVTGPTQCQSFQDVLLKIAELSPYKTIEI